MVIIPIPGDMYQKVYRNALDPSTASKIQPLHIYRHLLRATSYLPDEFARVYIRDFIRNKFHKSPRSTESLATRLKTARNSVRVLEQAANGEIKALTTALNMAYGRSGRRRRELMNDLLQADIKSSEGGGAWESPGPLLKLFIKSQAANQPLDNERTEIRTLQPIYIPTTWARPMPLNRRRNHEKRFWAAILDRLLPPLPEQEWDRLRDLATGEIQFEGPPARRSRVGTTPTKYLLDGAEYLKQPIRSADQRGRFASVAGRERHIITARFMRRMWSRVWNRCPKMTYNGETMEWTIVWGGGRSAASQNLTGSAGINDLELWNRLSEHDIKAMKRPSPTSQPRPAHLK